MSKDLFNFDSDNNNGRRRRGKLFTKPTPAPEPSSEPITERLVASNPIINIGNGNASWVVISILVVVIGFLIYFRNDNPINIQYQENIERLSEEMNVSKLKQDSIQKVAEFYMLRDVEWAKKDSANTYQIEQQQIITYELRIEKVIAQQETERVKKELI